MNERSNMLVGVAWYRPEQYTLLRALASDTDSMAATYDEWLAGANKLIADLEKEGARVGKVEVEVKELMAWCEQQGRPVDAAARAEFVAQKLRRGD